MPKNLADRPTHAAARDRQGAFGHKDIIQRANKIIDDDRPEARRVLENNIKILGMLSECIGFAEDSTTALNKSFGPSKEGTPRIGNL